MLRVRRASSLRSMGTESGLEARDLKASGRNCDYEVRGPGTGSPEVIRFLQNPGLKICSGSVYSRRQSTTRSGMEHGLLTRTSIPWIFGAHCLGHYCVSWEKKDSRLEVAARTTATCVRGVKGTCL